MKENKYPQRVRNELRFRELTVLRVERVGEAFQRIVLGGDSAGGQIAALLTAAMGRPELAAHYSMAPAVPAALRG